MGAGYGDVAEWVDAVDSKSTDFSHVSSNLIIATTDGYSLFSLLLCTYKNLIVLGITVKKLPNVYSAVAKG